MPLEAGDIQALAAALQGLRPAAPVNATAVKLPQFWQGNPEVWFKQTESVFTTRNPAITTQQTKFDYVIQALDNNTAEKVQSLILNPPAQPYDRLKAALIAAFGKSQAAKDQELLNLNGLGDRKPSELLQHMRNLNTIHCSGPCSWPNFRRMSAEFWPLPIKPTSASWRLRPTGSPRCPDSPTTCK